MEINEYKTIVEKTAIYPNKVDNFGLAYCWLGLIGETEELYLEVDNPDRKTIIKEHGDVLWYTTSICNILGIDLKEVFLKVDDVLIVPSQSNLIPSLNQFAEVIKKYYRDNKEIDKELMTLVLAKNLACISDEFNISDNEVKESMQMNYDKLMKRRETNTLSGSGSNREENIKEKFNDIANGRD